MTQSIIITGANRGLGLGFVDFYLKMGCHIIACCRNPQQATELNTLSFKFKDQLYIENLDVSDKNSIKGLGKRIEQLKIKFDIVINNAGICIEEEMGNWTPDSFLKTFEINTVGVALFCQEIIPFIKEGGKIVNMSSGMGSIDWNVNPIAPLDAYAMSKASLNMFSRRLALKMKSKNLLVVSLSPGWVQTEMGGSNAPDTVEQAVTKITKTISNLDMKDSGRFLSEEGTEIPW